MRDGVGCWEEGLNRFKPAPSLHEFLQCTRVATFGWTLVRFLSVARVSNLHSLEDRPVNKASSIKPRILVSFCPSFSRFLIFSSKMFAFESKFSFRKIRKDREKWDFSGRKGEEHGLKFFFKKITRHIIS